MGYTTLGRVPEFQEDKRSYKKVRDPQVGTAHAKIGTPSLEALLAAERLILAISNWPISVLILED